MQLKQSDALQLVRGIREKAREALRSGKLPSRKPDRTYGGSGTGVRCSLCGDVIEADQAEIEFGSTAMEGRQASISTICTSVVSPLGSSSVPSYQLVSSASRILVV
jgi:hypothetical protein